MSYNKFNSNSNYKPNGYSNYKSNPSPSGYNKKENDTSEKPQQQEQELPPAFYYKAYCVAASGDVPEFILDKFKNIAKYMEKNGYVVRFSHGEKVDNVIATHITENKEMHLPWKGFAEMESKFTYNSPEALAIAKDNHGAWSQLKKPVHGFLGRNVRLLLGKDTRSPAVLFLTYTEDGCENIRTKTQATGFMSFMIQVADKCKIPIFNLKNADAEQRIKEYLGFPETKNTTTANDHNYESDF
jgi:hypothetical protein